MSLSTTPASAAAPDADVDSLSMRVLPDAYSAPDDIGFADAADPLGVASRDRVIRRGTSPRRTGPVTRQFARPWLKGNTHTHTTYSDGDSSPETVVDWYAAHNYDFLFLTDHNVLIPDEHVERLQRSNMTVLQGEEVTITRTHVNGLGVRDPIGPNWMTMSAEERSSMSTAESIHWAAQRILDQGAVAIVAHPNLGFGMTGLELVDASPFGLMEVWNGHPGAWNEGDETHPSTDVMWDTVLTAGFRTWGVAADDAHDFQQWGEQWSNPGRGWLQVQAQSTSMGDMLEALQDGNFYASSGLELALYSAQRSRIQVELASEPATIELIGTGGVVLDAVEGQRATFNLRTITAEHAGGYVRVRASNPDGQRLWTQPLYL